MLRTVFRRTYSMYITQQYVQYPIQSDGVSKVKCTVPTVISRAKIFQGVRPLGKIH